MRVYLPVTMPLLAAGRQARDFGGQLAAHAVTPSVREWYTEGDEEELEFSALVDAANSSLRLLAADPEAPRRRVVVAAQVPDATVQPHSGAGQRHQDRSAVRLLAPVALADVVSVHVDDDDAALAVREAIAALPAADAGDADALFALDEAEAHDLLWYDVTEIDDLVPGHAVRGGHAGPGGHAADSARASGSGGSAPG